ncbi:MAG: hypothetical protein QXH08_00095 [Candidatus Hadarchaeales archaeon]
MKDMRHCLLLFSVSLILSLVLFFSPQHYAVRRALLLEDNPSGLYFAFGDKGFLERLWYEHSFLSSIPSAPTFVDFPPHLVADFLRDRGCDESKTSFDSVVVGIVQSGFDETVNAIWKELSHAIKNSISLSDGLVLMDFVGSPRLFSTKTGEILDLRMKEIMVADLKGPISLVFFCF